MRIYSIPLIALIISGCVPFVNRHKITVSCKKIEAYTALPKKVSTLPSVTIWVHGTRLLSDKMLHKLCLTPPGFNPIKQISQDYRIYKTAKLLTELDPSRFNYENFYAFGWSGKLSFSERKKVAQDLYNHIKTITLEYQKKYNKRPIIRIITHSHGGNVALNLAAVKNPSDGIYIEELILLGTPIQHETAHKAEDPFFRKIYSFFSTFDTIQILDPQGLQAWDKKSLPEGVTYKRCLLSERCFKLNPKIQQIQIKMHGRGILHIEFLLSKFLKLLPTLLDQIDKLEPQDAQIKLLHIKD